MKNKAKKVARKRRQQRKRHAAKRRPAPTPVPRMGIVSSPGAEAVVPLGCHDLRAKPEILPTLLRFFAMQELAVTLTVSNGAGPDGRFVISLHFPVEPPASVPFAKELYRWLERLIESLEASSAYWPEHAAPPRVGQSLSVGGRALEQKLGQPMFLSPGGTA